MVLLCNVRHLEDKYCWKYLNKYGWNIWTNTCATSLGQIFGQIWMEIFSQMWLERFQKYLDTRWLRMHDYQGRRFNKFQRVKSFLKYTKLQISSTECGFWGCELAKVFLVGSNAPGDPRFVSTVARNEHGRPTSAPFKKSFLLLAPGWVDKWAFLDTSTVWFVVTREPIEEGKIWLNISFLCGHQNPSYQKYLWPRNVWWILEDQSCW